jgi:VanZ family protein
VTAVASPRVRLALAWAPAVLTMAAIWVLSSMSNPPVPVHVIPFRDRGAHFLSFGSVAFWVAHGTLATRPRAGVLRVVLFSILATMLWGLLDEVHQSFVPNRTPDLGDLAADTLGGIVGASLRAIVRRVLRRPATPAAEVPA